MNSLIKNALYISVFFLGLSGCATQKATSPGIKNINEYPCNITENYDHIFNGHCPGGNNQHGDQFLKEFCSIEAQEALCIDMQNAPNEKREQENGRICYEKNLDYPIGNTGQTRGRLVIDPRTNLVVSQFPVVAGSTCPP